MPSSFSRIQHITDAGAPHGVAIHAERIEWAAAGALVARANIDGSVVNQNFITGARFSSAIGGAPEGIRIPNLDLFRNAR